MKKVLKILTTTLLCIGVLSGCGSSLPEGIEQNTNVKGKITINGSTSMEKLSNSIAEVFMQRYPKVMVIPQFTGSSAGIEAVLNGTSDIGNSSRALKQSEIEKGIVENIVALDGIAVIVDAKNPVSDLTLEQVRDIYEGKIRNWKELGGKDMGIVVIGREAGSGTRSAFEEIIDAENKCDYSQEIESTGAVVGKVEATEGAIGYVSLDVLHSSTAKPVKINGFEPNAENIKNGTYAISRPFVMATKGQIEEQSEAVQELFKFLKTEDGKMIIEKVGLINVD